MKSWIPLAEETINVPEGAAGHALFHCLCEGHDGCFSQCPVHFENTLLPNATILADGSDIPNENEADTEIDRKDSAHMFLITTALGGG
jgi:hypothetical protein